MEYCIVCIYSWHIYTYCVSVYVIIHPNTTLYILYILRLYCVSVRVLSYYLCPSVCRYERQSDRLQVYAPYACRYNIYNAQEVCICMLYICVCDKCVYVHRLCIYDGVCVCIYIYIYVNLYCTTLQSLTPITPLTRP